MPIITITSNQADTGKTTLAVNLAAGLAREGLPVLLLDRSINDDLPNWVKETAPALTDELAGWLWRPNLRVIFKTVPAPELAKSPFVIIDLDQSMVAQANDLLKISDQVYVVTPLKNLDFSALSFFIEIVKNARNSMGSADIDLIVPYMINPLAWEENEPALSWLADSGREDGIADPIPL